MDIYKKIARKKVVLVDDNREVREQFALYFRLKGCLVDTFENAEDASSSFDAGVPDLVISDFLLPGSDGMSFLKRLAREHPRTRTILITAYPNDLLVEEVKGGAVDGFLLKPFSVEEMEGVLEQVIEKSV